MVFKRAGAKAVFVKADVSTKRMLRVTIPDRMTPVMAIKDGSPIPTLFKIRVLAKRFGKKFTSERLSPFVGPELPPQPDKPAVDPAGDCDSDGQLNNVDVDDDNDLLLDSTEKGLPFPTDPCKYDTDGDGIGDGYEYRSARDLNNDEYQNLNAFVPYPGKKPYPNPLDASDADTDFDGDSLTLSEEHKLWKFTLAHGASAPTPAQLESPAPALTYSDGMKYSVYALTHGDDRRSPALAAAGYDKELAFKAWLQASGYWNIFRPDVPEGDPAYNGLLLDVNRDGSISETPTAGQWRSESHYLDLERQRLALGRRARRGRRRPHELRRVARPDVARPGGSRTTRERSRTRSRTPAPISPTRTRMATACSTAPTTRTTTTCRTSSRSAATPSRAARRIRRTRPRRWRTRTRSTAACSRSTRASRSSTRAAARRHWVPGLYAPFDGPPWSGDGEDPTYLVRN